MATNVPKKIKIARIITRMDLGGAQHVVLDLSRGLNPTLFEQIVITGDGGSLLPELQEIPSIRHFVVRALDRRIGIGGLWSDLKAVRSICDLLRQERPDIVHTHTPKAGIVGRWAARLARVPKIVHTYHGFGFSAQHPRWQRTLYTGLERCTARITDHFVVVSERNRLQAEEYGILARDRCEVIRSGIDFTRFQGIRVDKPQKKMELGISPSDKVVGVVASLTPAKGLHYFLDSARKIRCEMPNVLFVMVGDGALRPQLKEQIRRLRLEDAVRMLGWRQDIPELLPVFDVFLLTSLWEGLPRAIVEALLSGIPVVASNVDGIAEVVQDGKNGYLARPGDIETLARCVIRLLRDDSLRQRLSEFAKTSVSAFSVQKMLKDYTKLYENMTVA